MGGRSRAAAELLKGRGFAEVYNLKGGLRAWKGLTARGPESSGLSLLQGHEGRRGMLEVALALERGLERFYRVLAPQAQDPGVARLLGDLARVEQGHQAKVRALLGDETALSQDISLPLVEGGMPAGELVAHYQAQGLGWAGMLDLAMMIETQGMDLYLRLARRARPGEGREEMLALAQDEKAHLRALAGLHEEMPPD